MVTGEAKGRHLAISLIIASIPIILVGLIWANRQRFII
jgi:undecaprenyl-diphosphatase